MAFGDKYVFSKIARWVEKRYYTRSCGSLEIPVCPIEPRELVRRIEGQLIRWDCGLEAPPIRPIYGKRPPVWGRKKVRRSVLMGCCLLDQHKPWRINVYTVTVAVAEKNNSSETPHTT